MKTISIFLALVNSLLAGLLIAYSLSGGEIRQAPIWWLLTKVLAGLSVIVIGALMWFGTIGNVRASFMVLSSLCLVALGAATVVWTLHLAVVTGDMEYSMIIYGGSLIMQGAASQFGYPADSSNIAIS